MYNKGTYFRINVKQLRKTTLSTHWRRPNEKIKKTKVDNQDGIWSTTQ